MKMGIKVLYQDKDGNIILVRSQSCEKIKTCNVSERLMSDEEVESYQQIQQPNNVEVLPELSTLSVNVFKVALNEAAKEAIVLTCNVQKLQILSEETWKKVGVLECETLDYLAKINNKTKDDYIAYFNVSRIKQQPQLIHLSSDRELVKFYELDIKRIMLSIIGLMKSQLPILSLSLNEDFEGSNKLACDAIINLTFQARLLGIIANLNMSYKGICWNAQQEKTLFFLSKVHEFSEHMRKSCIALKLTTTPITNIELFEEEIKIQEVYEPTEYDKAHNNLSRLITRYLNKCIKCLRIFEYFTKYDICIQESTKVVLIGYSDEFQILLQQVSQLKEACFLIQAMVKNDNKHIVIQDKKSTTPLLFFNKEDLYSKLGLYRFILHGITSALEARSQEVFSALNIASTFSELSVYAQYVKNYLQYVEKFKTIIDGEVICHRNIPDVFYLNDLLESRRLKLQKEGKIDKEWYDR